MWPLQFVESVQCAECARVYDSDEHPFCPRCGSIGKSEAVGKTAASIHTRNHPKRRRAQVGGVAMTILGGITGILFLITAILAPSLVPLTLPTFEMQDGGELTVNVADGGVPLDGINVTILSLNDTFLAAAPTSNGSANFMLPQAGVRVLIENGASNWTWNVLSLNQTEDHVTINMDLQDPPGDHGWEGAETFVQGSRILGGIFAVICLFTFIGGVQAIRLRNRGVATAGAIVGGLPWLILFMMAPNFAVGLVLLTFVLAAAFIQGAKEHFV